MAVITASKITGSGQKPVTETVLGASDTLVYNRETSPVLYLNNETAGPLTPLIDGDGGTTVPCAGIGDVDVSAGLLLSSIAANAVVAIPLNSISAYLNGVVTITGATGIVASLLEFK
jgi:hypothetical protein